MTEKTEKRAYDNTRRQQRAILLSALRSLGKDEEEEQERVPRRVRNFRKRRAKLPADMRCPVCGEVTTASKSWVVGAALRAEQPVQCKSCWSARLAKLKESNDATT